MKIGSGMRSILDGNHLTRYAVIFIFAHFQSYDTLIASEASKVFCLFCKFQVTNHFDKMWEILEVWLLLRRKLYRGTCHNQDILSGFIDIDSYSLYSMGLILATTPSHWKTCSKIVPQNPVNGKFYPHWKLNGKKLHSKTIPTGIFELKTMDFLSPLRFR